MAWKKVKIPSGEVYVSEESKYITHYLKDFNIHDLNDENRDLSFSKHPEYITELVPDHDGIELPSGIYSLRADDIYEEPRLYPLIPSHDDSLFELEVVQDVLKDFKDFIKSESIYKGLGILHKKGVLLYGEPGTGKTSAIQMIINKIRPVNSLVIYVTKEIPENFIKEMKRDTRLKIIVFEELVHTIKQYNISRFLTFLDGESSTDNTYFIATTNYPENLPSNIVDRPGRFDKLYKIDNLSLEDRKTYLKHFLNRAPNTTELNSTKGFTVAAIKEILLLMLRDSLTIEEAVEKIKKHQSIVKKSFKKMKDMGFNEDD